MTDQITCLHGFNGKVLYATSQGSSTLLSDSQFKFLLRQVGVYRVMAVSENYRLITEAHSALVGNASKSRLLIGSPLLCRRQKETAEQVLNCLSVLSVHDCLFNAWHVMDNTLYNNYLLLRVFNENGVSDLTQNVYKHHCLKPVFDFMGLNDINKAIDFISLIVDPRWYISATRPYRLTRFDRHFGLHVRRFHQLWENSKLFTKDKNYRGITCLINIVKAMDRHNFVLQDLEDKWGNPSTLLKACRRVLSFVVRNWLTTLTGLAYFDPVLFFQQTEARNAYLQCFRE